MRRGSVLLWIVVALLLLLVYLTVTGRLGRSRHGYAAAPAVLAQIAKPSSPPRSCRPAMVEMGRQSIS